MECISSLRLIATYVIYSCLSKEKRGEEIYGGYFYPLSGLLLWIHFSIKYVSDKFTLIRLKCIIFEAIIVLLNSKKRM